MMTVEEFHKGPSIKDVSPEGEGGGTPKRRREEMGEVPCLEQRRRLFLKSKFAETFVVHFHPILEAIFST